MIFIETLEGVVHNLHKAGIVTQEFIVDSPKPVHTTEKPSGKNGHIDMGTTFEGRTMRGVFFMESSDAYDYVLLRDEIFKLFDGSRHFYLIDSYQLKKRWLVKTADMFTPNRIDAKYGTVEIPFISPLPYAESYGTTLEPFTFDAEKWQVGQNVILLDGGLKYAHNTTTFAIWNGSDIDIDPRELPLLIKYQGASSNLKIKNTTTGEEWAYNGTSGPNDTIRLDGVRALKNNLSIYRDTNRKLITLRKGWNDFTLSGTSGSFLISFDFRFYTF